MNGRTLWAAIAAAALTSCASRAWYKDASSEQDFRVDRGQCIAQAHGVSNPQPMQRDVVFHGCMEGKGWVFR